ncbi:MAG: type II toxin-antitoxin system HipA family toxin [Spirochaetales bacterium]|nr:type II toxin-antitoxin system HipA family toxin [Candidatus Physcosoma equi]
MVEVTKASVLYGERRVGVVAQKGQSVAFEYDDEWIHSGFSISPFSLPLEGKLFIGSYEPFRGIFGVFDDLLPDGWGQLLTDRYLHANGIDPSSINMVTRLTLLSSNGMGALRFLPEQVSNTSRRDFYDFDELKHSCDAILNDKECADLDEVYQMGGSSGGARPKAYVNFSGESWIVKFPSSMDGADIGKQEYLYNQCAMHCGLDVSEVQLLPSALCSGYFATKRFDRRGDNRVHMVSLGGLLEASHRYPTLDYDHLFRVTQILTRSREEICKVFRHMCFNEFSHNWDDHAKNFSFLFDEDAGWRLSPAYDLTFSSSFGGEHATTVNRKGKNITKEDLYLVGHRYGLNQSEMTTMLDEVETAVRLELKDVVPFFA